jgi:ParB family chromosome partitioning protein
VSSDKKRGLGRGLASLIPDSALEGAERPIEARPLLRVVPLDEIRASPVQPRDRFDQVQLESLAESIRLHGILQPLVVRREEGHYVIIAGERRFRAAAYAGLLVVPVIVREVQTLGEQLQIGLVENLQRSDLDPIEAARGYHRLMDEFGLTQQEVADQIGKDRTTVANAIRLLKLPVVAIDAVRDGRITAGHGRALLAVASEKEIQRLVGRVIADGLSVRALERLIAREQRVEPAPKVDKLAPVAKRVGDALKAKVTIKARNDGGGRMTVDYSDPEHLEAILRVLEKG